jgi:NADPH-dependent curcumin reductase CurA
MRGLVLGRVQESNAEGFGVGDLVYGVGQWQEYCAIDAPLVTRVIPFGDISLDNYANLFSMIGATSYVGMVDIGRPRAGDTVVVSGAAGATGSLACQIANILDCKVVGIAGGEEKCRYLMEIGCDAAVDYKANNLSEDLKCTCPEGIDVFFDNVGGEMLDMIVGGHMALNSTVVMCGAISQYSNPTDPDALYHFKNMLAFGLKRMRLEGFVILDHVERYDEIFRQLNEWYKAGKIKPRSHILKGLEQAPRALQMVLQGKNHGKMMIEVARD